MAMNKLNINANALARGLAIGASAMRQQGGQHQGTLSSVDGQVSRASQGQNLVFRLSHRPINTPISHFERIPP